MPRFPRLVDMLSESSNRLGIFSAVCLVFVSLGSLVDIFTICAILCLTAMGYCLYLLRELNEKERSSSARIYKEVYSRVQEVQNIIETTSTQLQDYQIIINLLRSQNIKSGQQTVRDIVNIRRVIIALKKRRDDVIKLLNSNKSKDLVEARQLIRKNISVDENYAESLIGSDHIPEIAPDGIVIFISEILKRIEEDLKVERKAA